MVVVVALLMSVSPFTMDMYLPALPEMARALDATPSQVQLSLTGVLVGLALGQLVAGPLADAFGRRRPVLVGLVGHIVASLLCFVARDPDLLAGTRLLQGLSCAAVAVVAMATVRDLFAGSGYARVMSRMFLVIGVAPVLAPTIGGGVLTVAEWPFIFLALAGLGVLLLVVAATSLPETLPPERRGQATFTAVRASYRTLLGDPTYLSLILVGGLMFSTLFSYVSGASFVLQVRFGLSQQQFALVFAANAVGLTVLAQVNPLLIRRFGPANVLTCATVLGLVSSALLFPLLVFGEGPLVAVVAVLALSVAGYGLSMPNSQALALNRQGHRAGTAAALMGFMQFVIGSVVAPVVGLGGADGVAMATAMLAATACAASVMWFVVRRHPETMAVR
ncbi:Bcr/CflA family drug resistance efflux transporter [Streptomyces brasiliensis]|uniref:Bcr/CflA family drug resistance efflux transporter n=2 Tax=Streptomyces brasiliensis TaxID=1954 RepID=A0A917L3Q1_9ACTN|nr:Bcr/CflA family drug resistance efflux transporter [Streptomyces brasiliensis]